MGQSRELTGRFLVEWTEPYWGLDIPFKSPGKGTDFGAGRGGTLGTVDRKGLMGKIKMAVKVIHLKECAARVFDQLVFWLRRV